MAKGLPFIIVGAGIGGLTAALALAARGVHSIVVERAGALSKIGAGIQLAPNAGRVFAELGLDDAIHAAAVEPAAIDVCDGMTGRRLASLKGASFRAAYGFPYRVIHRAELQAILVEAVAKSQAVRVVLGASVEDCVPQPGSVAVRFGGPGGAETIQAAAVVAADGVWSNLRNRIAGAAAAEPTGRTAWRAVIPAASVKGLAATDRVALWLGPRSHLVHYPIAHGTGINVVAVVEEHWNEAGWEASGNPAEVQAAFKRWGATARAIVAAGTVWQKFAIATVDARRAWRQDKIVLLGDAAHAMPPFLAQGAAMAIEDAAVLAAALAADADVSRALARYVTARQARTAAVAAASRRAGNRFHWSGPIAAARNLALRIAGERLMMAGNDEIYRWRPPAGSG